MGFHNGCIFVDLRRSPQKSPGSQPGRLTWVLDDVFQIQHSSSKAPVKQFPVCSSDVRRVRESNPSGWPPLECVKDIVQYPLATLSRRCLPQLILGAHALDDSAKNHDVRRGVSFRECSSFPLPLICDPNLRQAIAQRISR